MPSLSMLLQAFKGADYLFIVTEGGVVDPKAELQQGMNAADAAEQARPCTDVKASECCIVQGWCRVGAEVTWCRDRWCKAAAPYGNGAEFVPDCGGSIAALPGLLPLKPGPIREPACPNESLSPLCWVCAVCLLQALQRGSCSQACGCIPAFPGT